VLNSGGIEYAHAAESGLTPVRYIVIYKPTGARHEDTVYCHTQSSGQALIRYWNTCDPKRWSYEYLPQAPAKRTWDGVRDLMALNKLIKQVPDGLVASAPEWRAWGNEMRLMAERIAFSIEKEELSSVR
jgi:hypothetical protein